MTRQHLRRIDRQIIKIMKTDGDRCSICHTPFQHNSATYGGTIADGTAALVGDCCVKNLKLTYGAGIYLAHPDQREPWKKDDAKWFAENPSRSHRIRPGYPHEPCSRDPDAVPEGCTPFVLLRQIEPGKRAKLPLAVHNSLLPIPDCDALLHAIFDTCLQESPSDGWKMASKEKIRDLALQYAAADQQRPS